MYELESTIRQLELSRNVSERETRLNSALVFVYLLIYGLLMVAVSRSEYIVPVGRITNK
jgi:hypothetical protein